MIILYCLFGLFALYPIYLEIIEKIKTNSFRDIHGNLVNENDYIYIRTKGASRWRGELWGNRSKYKIVKIVNYPYKTSKYKTSVTISFGIRDEGTIALFTYDNDFLKV